MPRIRPLVAADAQELLVLRRANAAFLAPFEPVRGYGFLTLVGQQEAIADQLARRAAGVSASYVIVEDGAIVGQVTLSSIVSWPHLSANLGYWVAEPFCRRGIGSAAVGAACAEAFGPLGLHRVQAGTLVDNIASQRVLEHNGFRRIGLARRYLLIAGEWRDHVLFELLADG